MLAAGLRFVGDRSRNRGAGAVPLKRMRILIIQDYLRCGGTERQSVFLSRFFQAEGNEVCLLTFRPGGVLAKELLHADFSHRSLQPRDTGFDFAPGLFRAIREWQPEVVLCMGQTANCYGGIIQLRFPSVAIVGSARLGKPINIPALNLWSFRRVSGVIANSAWWRTNLVDRGVCPAKIKVVRNGLAYDWDRRDPRSTRRRMRLSLGLRPSTIVFLNVAGFRKGKRQALLIELFSTLDPEWDWELWLVGNGKEWNRCRKLADRIAPERVRFMGHVEDPFECYAAADVAVSASVRDSLPNFLVEAQTLGLPVIASDFRGVGEGMRHGETGFLIGPHDRAGFLEAVHELHRGPELRRRMGQQARVFAAENCARELQASKTLEALRAFYSKDYRSLQVPKCAVT